MSIVPFGPGCKVRGPVCQRGPFPISRVPATVESPMPSYEDLFPRFAHRLRDHNLYRRNPTFANPPWGEASQRVLILRLSSFADVERSTPHLFLADELRRAGSGSFIDVAFLPRRDDARVLEEHGLPLIVGTQSLRSLDEFDLLLVSNAWLLELVNLPFLLAHSGVPVWASERDEQWPPIILGGSNATASHPIVNEAGNSMADSIFFGEGEGAVGEIARIIGQRGQASKKERVARAAATVPGLWPAGSLVVSVKKAVRPADALSAVPWSAPVLPGPEAGTARIAITLGCPCFCSFCFEGHDRRPYREIPEGPVLEAARARKIATGAATIELESFNFNVHTGLSHLLLGLHRLYLRVGLMSQRVDILARTPGLLDLEIAADKRSFTLGIEGVSGRLRRFLHKSLDDADITAALQALHARRIRELKLFYILTGRERESDFDELAGFVKQLRLVRRATESAPRLVFSFGLLVRMPFTPLRYDPPLLSEPAWRPLIGRAKSICETNGFEFRLSHPWSEYAATQALALGGHAVHGLLTAIASRGCVTSEGLPPGAEEEVRQWIELHASELLGEKPAEHAFAFSFLETDTTRAALHAQYQRALEGRDRGYGSRWVRSENDGAALRESARALAEVTRAKHVLKPLFVAARMPRESAGLGREWGEAFLMRSLLTARPELVDTVLAIQESLIEQSGVMGPRTAWFGRTVVGITAWDAHAVEAALAALPRIFLGPVVGFVPGSFSEMSITLDLPAALFPDPLAALAAHLQRLHSSSMIKREGDDRLLLPAEKALKKKLVMEARASRSGDGWHLALQVGAKFSLGDFLDSIGPDATALAGAVEVTGVR